MTKPKTPNNNIGKYKTITIKKCKRLSNCSNSKKRDRDMNRSRKSNWMTKPKTMNNNIGKDTTIIINK